MTLSRQHKVTIISLLLYWPTIFVLTHIPLPQELLQDVHVSDKTLHYTAYLILVFLLWFAISPDRKVNWRRATAWWVLLVVVWYGVFDEWLQGYVNRNPNIMDFFADLAGAITSLILLSILPFWPAFLALTAAIIFILTNFTRVNLAELLSVPNAAFHLFAYGLFTLLWIRNMYRLLPIRAPEKKWLIGALAMPISFLLAVELFSTLAGNDFRLQDVTISAVAIVTVVAIIFLTALFRQRSTQKLPPGNT